ncbi:MAG: hypothetical protein KGV50_03285 [Gammaproteobacteria bacterium]|nr:hypothetical protein [Gammaproteobacteria bacterium]
MFKLLGKLYRWYNKVIFTKLIVVLLGWIFIFAFSYFRFVFDSLFVSVAVSLLVTGGLYYGVRKIYGKLTGKRTTKKPQQSAPTHVKEEKDEHETIQPAPIANSDTKLSNSGAIEMSKKYGGGVIER